MFSTSQYKAPQQLAEFKERTGFQKFLPEPHVVIPANSRDFIKYLSLKELNAIEMEAKQYASALRKLVKNRFLEVFRPKFDILGISALDISKNYNAVFRLADGCVKTLAMIASIVIVPMTGFLMHTFLFIYKFAALLFLTLLAQLDLTAKSYKNFVPYCFVPNLLAIDIKNFTETISKKLGFKIKEYENVGDALNLIDGSLLPLIKGAKRDLMAAKHTFHLHSQRKSVDPFVKDYILGLADMLKPDEDIIVLKK